MSSEPNGNPMSTNATIEHAHRIYGGLLRDKSEKPPNSPNNGVRFPDKTYIDPMMVANQYTPPPIRLACHSSKRQFKRQFHQLPMTGMPSFTHADSKEAIRLAKSSTAIGRDEHPLPQESRSWCHQLSH